MKLSLRKHFGFIHCTGGAIVRVASEHAVTGASIALNDEHARIKPPKWVFAKEGDLAVEIVAVKTGKVLGHCYLTGPAVQLHRYTEPQGDWFKPATGKMFPIPLPYELHGKDEKERFDEMMAHISDLKYANVDVAAFEVQVKGKGEAKDASESISYMLRLEKDGDDRKMTAHILGLVAEPRGKPSITLHFQPEGDVDECGASGFGVSLVLRALKEVEK
jgi:hypothetical protein